MNKLVIAIAALLITSTSSFAFSEKEKSAPKNETRQERTVPVCTGENTLFEILGNKCELVKGSDPYRVSGMSGLDAIVPSIGATVGTPLSF